MEIIVGKTAGFCYGVKNAIDKVEESLEKYNSIFCLGELVHNNHVINNLEKKGLKTIDNISQANKRAVIRAHGIAKHVYKEAEERDIEILDYTCPNVLRIHKIAEEYAKKGFYIILVGAKEHAENIGTISFCGEFCYILEDSNEIDIVISKIQKSKKQDIMLLVQTTYSMEKFEKIVELLKDKLNGKNIVVNNTICNATKIRQEETKKIASIVDAMIIIGGKKSSNTNKLYNISKSVCNNTQIVESKEDIDFTMLKGIEKIGIMAGASTPNDVIQDVVDILNV